MWSSISNVIDNIIYILGIVANFLMTNELFQIILAVITFGLLLGVIGKMVYTIYRMGHPSKKMIRLNEQYRNKRKNYNYYRYKKRLYNQKYNKKRYYKRRYN